jgi:hypothetical protein
MNTNSSESGKEKTKRLYFKTYLQLIKNSMGTRMFRNFYIQNSDAIERDAVSDGSDSCAFYVSSVLTIFKKISGVHGTVASTIEDLHQSDWREVEASDKKAGDIPVWEQVEISGQDFEHIGFYIGGGRAVSTSWTKKVVVEHSADFNSTRAISHAFRCYDWNEPKLQ